MNDSARLVIICALEMEVRKLVAGWKRDVVEIPGRAKIHCWRQGQTVVMAAGTGWDRAAKVAEWAIESFKPELVTSVGYSGSLTRALGAGSLVVPAQVVGFKSSTSFETGVGTGVLFTAAGVASATEKASLARSGALAVDMEAAAVAEAAKRAGVRFAAVKAISDGVDDQVEFTQKFVTPDGFRTGAFLGYVAFRPWLWGAVGRLATNSKKAGETLTAALRELVEGPEEFLKKYSRTEVSAPRKV